MQAELSWEEAVRSLLERPECAEIVRDCYYDQPTLSAAERFASSSEWRSTAALLPSPPGAAVDLGAGQGISSYALAREGWRVTAIEPDPSNLVGRGSIARLAADSGLPITVAEGVGENIPLPDASQDLVFARAVLHHAKHLEALCREAFRVLRPGGRMLATREHVISKAEDLHAFLDSHPLHSLYGGEHAYLLREYEGALVGAGFTLDKIIRPLSSEINLAPRTLESVAHAALGKLPDIPGLRKLASPFIKSPSLLNFLLVVANHFDNRPGRLFSFYCTRPT